MRRTQRRAAELAARNALASSGSADPVAGRQGAYRVPPFEIADDTPSDPIEAASVADTVAGPPSVHPTAIEPEPVDIPAPHVSLPGLLDGTQTADDVPADAIMTVSAAATAPEPSDLDAAVAEPEPVDAPTADDSLPLLQAGADQPPSATEAHLGFDRPEAQAQLLMQAAREAVERGAHERAVSSYRKLLRLDPTRVDTRTQLALVLEAQGMHEEAIEHLDQCVRESSEPVAALVSRASVLSAQWQYVDAEHDLHRALQLEPSNADAHYNFGLVKIRRGRWSDAIPHLRRAVELDQSRAPAHFYLGEALNHIDDLDGALQAYQRATELQPHYAEAFYGLGIILDRLGRPGDAAIMYRRSREIAQR